jgi:hypothetical protein
MPDFLSAALHAGAVLVLVLGLVLLLAYGMRRAKLGTSSSRGDFAILARHRIDAQQAVVKIRIDGETFTLLTGNQTCIILHRKRN